MEESSISRVPSRGGVSFLNVARTYIPNTKVECHYTLPPGTVPSASDWIGIFKVYTWNPFRLKFMGHGLVGVGRMTRLLDSQRQVDRELREKMAQMTESYLYKQSSSPHLSFALFLTHY